MLNITDLTFGYQNEPILDSISGMIGRNQKVGLVGVNGAGKSTLLKIVIGEIAQDSGEIQRPNSFGYIAQDLTHDMTFEEGDTIGKFINSNTQEEFPDYKIAKLLSAIGLDDKTVNSDYSLLSGGQKTKVAIVKLLLENPELLILDEPTNFLDIQSANWLMNYLCTYKGAVLVVSHDLRLMNRKLDKIWFLNEFTHKLEQYNGNYEHFLEIKALQDETIVNKLKKQERQYKKLFQTATNLSKYEKTALKSKAAKTFEKARKLKASIKDTRTKSKKIRIKLSINKEPGHQIIEVKNISKAFKTDTGIKQVLVNVNFSLTRRQRLVVIGVNGIGKSTLLKILAGIYEPDNGPDGRAKITFGQSVDFGYYAQEYDDLDYSKTPIEEIEENDIGKARAFLGNFLFTGDKVFQPISTLSGGERTRLALAKIFYQGHNLLILDEPTTFLDPQSKKTLGEVLANYPETIIMVTHDPEMVETIKPTHALLLPEEKFTHYDPSYINRVTIE